MNKIKSLLLLLVSILLVSNVSSVQAESISNT